MTWLGRLQQGWISQALLAIAVSLALLAPLHAQETITLVGEDDWYPYAAERDGQLRGLAVDLITQAYQTVGVQVKFKAMPYARCMDQVKTGAELGCFDTTYDSTLGAEYIFHEVPMFTAIIGIYAPAQSKVKGMTAAQLTGRRVGLTHGYTYGDAVEQNASIQRDMARTDLLNLRKLVLGRTEYSLMFTRVVEHLVATHPDEFKGKIARVGTVMENGLFVSFSRRRPESMRFAKLLDQGLQNLHKSRTYERILKRWESPSP